MMHFAITAINERKEIRQFTYGLNDLGIGLDFIHDLLIKGDSLVSVQITDQQGVINLPIETFDAVPPSKVLDQLETEWKAILASSPSSEAKD